MNLYSNSFRPFSFFSYSDKQARVEHQVTVIKEIQRRLKLQQEAESKSADAPNLNIALFNAQTVLKKHEVIIMREIKERQGEQNEMWTWGR